MKDEYQLSQTSTGLRGLQKVRYFPGTCRSFLNAGFPSGSSEKPIIDEGLETHGHHSKSLSFKEKTSCIHNHSSGAAVI